MGTPLRHHQVRRDPTDVGLRYPSQLRIDFSDPKVAEDLYDLFDQLGLCPEIGQLRSMVTRLMDRVRYLEKTDAGQASSILEWEDEFKISESRVDELEKKNRSLLKRLDGDTEVVALRKKIEHWETKSREKERKLQDIERTKGKEIRDIQQAKDEAIKALEQQVRETKQTLEQEIKRLKALNKELDW